MTDQEILDNAPDGATHWDCSEYMIHVHGGDWNYWSKAAGWNETKPEEETRSLADIKRIAELEAELRSLNNSHIFKCGRIAEIEKELESALYFNIDVVRCLSKIAWEHNHDEIPAYMELSKECIKSIELKQEKALKEQGDE